MFPQVNAHGPRDENRRNELLRADVKRALNVQPSGVRTVFAVSIPSSYATRSFSLRVGSGIGAYIAEGPFWVSRVLLQAAEPGGNGRV